jgi:hypothetical protein
MKIHLAGLMSPHAGRRTKIRDEAKDIFSLIFYFQTLPSFCGCTWEWNYTSTALQADAAWIGSHYHCCWYRQPVDLLTVTAGPTVGGSDQKQDSDRHATQAVQETAQAPVHKWHFPPHHFVNTNMSTITSNGMGGAGIVFKTVAKIHEDKV